MIFRNLATGLVVDSDVSLDYPYERVYSPRPESPVPPVERPTHRSYGRTVKAIIAEVGDDIGQADAALAWELAQDRPRSTLVAALKRILDDESR